MIKFFYDWLTGSFSNNEIEQNLPDPDIPDRILRKVIKTVTYSKYVMVTSQAEAIEVTKDRKVIAIVGTKKNPKWLLMNCPCGCNEVLRVNLSPAMRLAWRVNFLSSEVLSLYPSVDLESGCRAHFILRANKALVL